MGGPAGGADRGGAHTGTMVINTSYICISLVVAYDSFPFEQQSEKGTLTDSVYLTYYIYKCI